MNADDCHRELDAALALLKASELRFTAEQERNRRPGEPAAVGNIRARDTQEMRDCMADWSLAHQRIQSYAAAAMAKDLAEFLRPDVADLPPLEFDARSWGSSAVTP